MLLIGGIACPPVMAQADAPTGGCRGSADSDAASPADRSYDELPLTAEQEKAFKKKQNSRWADSEGREVRRPAGQREFDDFYSNYFLARWTLLKNITASARVSQQTCGIISGSPRAARSTII